MYHGQHIHMEEDGSRTLISGPTRKIKALANKMLLATKFTHFDLKC